VFIDLEGTATAHFFNDRVTLEGDGASLMDDDRTAVIVHRLPDLYGEDAGAGERMACGVLEHRI
jgi:Cu-Zn family superoxide dismutase